MTTVAKTTPTRGANRTSGTTAAQPGWVKPCPAGCVTEHGKDRDETGFGIHLLPEVTIGDWTIQPIVEDHMDDPGHESLVRIDGVNDVTSMQAWMIGRALITASELAVQRHPAHAHDRMWCARYSDTEQRCLHRDDSVHEGLRWSTGTLTKTDGDVSIELYELYEYDEAAQGERGYTLVKLGVTDMEVVPAGMSVLLTEQEAERLIAGLQRTLSRIRGLRAQGDVA